MPFAADDHLKNNCEKRQFCLLSKSFSTLSYSHTCVCFPDFQYFQRMHFNYISAVEFKVDYSIFKIDRFHFSSSKTFGIL